MLAIAVFSFLMLFLRIVEFEDSWIWDMAFASCASTSKIDGERSKRKIHLFQPRFLEIVWNSKNGEPSGFPFAKHRCGPKSAGPLCSAKAAGRVEKVGAPTDAHTDCGHLSVQLLHGSGSFPSTYLLGGFILIWFYYTTFPGKCQ